jgi:hypothetical protein
MLINLIHPLHGTPNLQLGTSSQETSNGKNIIRKRPQNTSPKHMLLQSTTLLLANNPNPTQVPRHLLHHHPSASRTAVHCCCCWCYCPYNYYRLPQNAAEKVELFLTITQCGVLQVLATSLPIKPFTTHVSDQFCATSAPVKQMATHHWWHQSLLRSVLHCTTNQSRQSLRYRHHFFLLLHSHDE